MSSSTTPASPPGAFEAAILANIRSRAHFIVLLTPTALNRCDEPGDWFRREIETALDNKRNIIPLYLERFTLQSPGVSDKLSGRLAALKEYQGLPVYSEYFDDAMKRLRDKWLNVPLSTILHPSAIAAQAAMEQAAAAAAAPEVTVETCKDSNNSTKTLCT